MNEEIDFDFWDKIIQEKYSTIIHYFSDLENRGVFGRSKGNLLLYGKWKAEWDICFNEYSRNKRKYACESAQNRIIELFNQEFVIARKVYSDIFNFWEDDIEKSMKGEV